MSHIVSVLSSGSITAYVDSFDQQSSGWFIATNKATGLPSASYYLCEFLRYDDNTAQLRVRGTAGRTTYRKNLIAGEWDDFWTTEWTSDNDGSGSGLDADLLDGQHGSYYAKVNTVTSSTATDLPVGSYITAPGETALYLNASTNVYIAASTVYTLKQSGELSELSGTWRICGATSIGSYGFIYLVRRVA